MATSFTFRNYTCAVTCQGRHPATLARARYTTLRKERDATVADSPPNETSSGNPDLIDLLRAEIAAAGPITFARFMEQALYHPEHGYYLSPVRRPGRSGDFLTAPETHPFFGLTIARQVLEMYARLEGPRPFTILEYGSGVGGLAYDVIVGMLEAEPEMRDHLRYRFNEVNQHRVAQALSAMDEIGLGDLVDVDDDTSPITGVILANEVADAMPVHRLRWTGTELAEVFVDWRDGSFVDVIGPLSLLVVERDPEASLRRAGIDLAALPPGARLDVSPAATAWMRALAARLERGYALIVDYGYPAAELYRDHRLEGTVRAHSHHTVTDDPYGGVGEQDLTAHVDFTSLIETATGAGMELVGLTTQADFLSGAGLGDLLVGLQSQPDVAVEEYLRAQAATFRLIDPGGMGRFRVLGLAKHAPVLPPLRGFASSNLPSGLRL